MLLELAGPVLERSLGMFRSKKTKSLIGICFIVDDSAVVYHEHIFAPWFLCLCCVLFLLT